MVAAWFSGSIKSRWVRAVFRFVQGFSAGLVLLAGGAAGAQPTYNDVVFATVGGQPMVLDLTVPSGGPPGPWPVLIWIHGGGWSSGSHNGVPPFASALLTSGVAVASVQYRLTSEAGAWGSEEVIWPAQIHDVKGAVRFLRANAGVYGLDPTRFASWGSSAGGHLSAVLGTSGGIAELEGSVGGNGGQSSRVQAALSYFGPTDLLEMQNDVTSPPGSSFNHDAPTSPESRLIGFGGVGEGIGVLRANRNNPSAPYPALMDRITLASPALLATADDAPMFIEHGTADATVPFGQGIRLRDALTTAGVPNVFVVADGVGHAAPSAAINQQAQDFLLSVFFPPAGIAVCEWAAECP